MAKVIRLMREFPIEKRSWEDVKSEIKLQIKVGNQIVARDHIEASALSEIILEDETYSHVRIIESVSRRGHFYGLVPVEKSTPIIYPCTDLTDVYVEEMKNQGRLEETEFGVIIKGKGD